MFISKRQFSKFADEREAKISTGFNFEFAKNKLTESGKSPTPEEIKSYIQSNDSEMPISIQKRELIRKIKIEERSRLNINEAMLLIIGSVLTSASEMETGDKIKTIEWYLKYYELKPGDIEKDHSFIMNDSNSVKEAFDAFYSKVLEEKTKADQAEKKSEENSEKNKYKTPLNGNFIQYTFENGWKVVYVPAIGEDIGNGQKMPIFGHWKKTSYDRVLEGNKMGICLGEQLRMYQDNSKGKIYSIRDLNNEPKATIRIDRKSLQECKGKGNSTPSIEVCALAKEWFDHKGIDYKNNQDYLGFPPLTKESASKEFQINKDKAYDTNNGWISSWYRKGITEIDNDVKDKIESNDPKVLCLANKFPKLVQKVYEHLCSKVTDSSDLSEILINSVDYYSKLECSKKLFSLIAKNKPDYFLEKGYHEKPESKEFAPIAYKRYAEIFPKYFLEKGWDEKPESKEFAQIAYKGYAEKKPDYFLEKGWDEKPESKEFAPIAYKRYAEIFPDYFLAKGWDEKPESKEFAPIAYKRCAEEYPYFFLEQGWDEKPESKEFAPIAYKRCAEEYPYFFLEQGWDEKPESKEFAQIAYKGYAEKKPDYFLEKGYHEKPESKEFAPIAYKRCAEEYPYFFLEKGWDEKPESKEFAPIAYKRCAEIFPDYFLAKGWDEKPESKEFAPIAYKRCAEEYPNYFLEQGWDEKPESKEFAPIAYKRCAKKDPHYFLAKGYHEKPESKEFAPIAYEALEEFNKEASLLMKKNIKISKHKELESLAFMLQKMGLRKELHYLKKIC